MCDFGVEINMQMPEMDGFEATRQIRKVEKSGEETTRMLEAGMDDYLSKPLERDRLLQTMGRLVRM